jgi:predicted nucleotidyltransferase
MDEAKKSAMGLDVANTLNIIYEAPQFLQSKAEIFDLRKIVQLLMKYEENHLETMT